MSYQRFLMGMVLCLLGAARAHAAQFIPLGFLQTGSQESWATGVSSDGQVVVGTSIAAGGREEAFSWTLATGMLGLGDLPGGIFESNASASSLAGHRVVGASKSGPQSEAFWWSEGDGMVGLGGLGGTPTFSWANSVSDSGAEIVGYSSNISGNSEAFLWKDGGMVGLGDLPGGVSDSSANGISADGSVIVGGSNSANGSEAFRWTADGGMVGLGDLPGGAYGSGASGVSADGSVIVGHSSSANGSEAFRWTAGGGMVGLGDLAGGDFVSSAAATSFDGSIVVGISFSEAGPEAFVWDEHQGMRRLRQVLVEQGVDLSGWRLIGARGVSADGRTIVGDGWNPQGVREAFWARLNLVCEPSGTLLFVGGLPLTAFLRVGRLRRPSRSANARTPFANRRACGSVDVASGYGFRGRPMD